MGEGGERKRRRGRREGEELRELQVKARVREEKGRVSRQKQKRKSTFSKRGTTPSGKDELMSPEKWKG